MFFRTIPWLWLYLRIGIILPSKPSSFQEQRKKHCYQLNKVPCSLKKAESYCNSQRGSLAYTWNQDVERLISSYLESGKKWWIGQKIMQPRKSHDKNNPAGGTYPWAIKPNKCACVSRNFNRISLEEDLCSQGHYFICQADGFSDQHASYENDENNSHLHMRPKKRKQEVETPRNRMTSGTHLSIICHQPAHANLSKILCLSISPPVPSSITGQVPPASSAPVSLLHAVISEPTRSASVTHAAESLLAVTSSRREDTHPDIFTTLQQASFQNVSDQVIEEIAGNLSKAIHNLQAQNQPWKICEVLQKLTTFLPRLSESTQVSIINSFIYLNEKLLKSQAQNSREIPMTVCLFHSLDDPTEAGEASRQRAMSDSEPGEDALEMPLLPPGQVPGVSVAQASSVATLMLSTQNISTLPLSSYTLGYPAPVRLGFPSASALEQLLNKHPGVHVQVTGLAFNPFKDFDDKNIVGSVGSVVLSTNHKLLHVHDLKEDIEIMLWRNVSMDTYPTSFNVSTDHFVIAVNITTLEKSLLVSIEPESPLLMDLYLGFQYLPNDTDFHLNVTLPKGQSGKKDEEYTWVLTPEHLHYGTGTYYLTVVLHKSQEGTEKLSTSFSVVTALTQCYFWDSYNSTWSSEGCQVGLQSTILKTQCLCDHLTYFGSDFFVVPRTVDVRDTIKLFLRVTNNPVGVSLLASLLGFYVLTFVWAWRKDKADMQKVKVTVLADNDPDSQFNYIIQVYTGYRRNAATTAKVVITLYGSEGRSEPHHLCDSQKTVFERGGLDVFLLCTQSSLGDLHSLRLWHDNSGVSPSWYVNQVIVIDLVAKRKWHFLCNCWLAVDLEDCQNDRVFRPVSKNQLFSFRQLFSSMIVEKFTQDYLWLSVITRHPWNQLTRVQRLTSCMTLLLCNTVINVMFWKISDSTVKREEQVGPFAVTWTELLTSIQTAVILFPANLIIGHLFHMIQPQEPLPLFPPSQAFCLPDTAFKPLSPTEIVQELKETVGFLLRRNTYFLSEWEQSSWSSCNTNRLVKLLSSLVSCHLESPGCHQQTEPCWANVIPEDQHHLCHYLRRVLQRLRCHLSTLGLTQDGQSCDFVDTTSQLQKLQELLETHILHTEQQPGREATSFPILSLEERKKTNSKVLTRWLAYVSWFLLSVTGLSAAFFTALYSLELNKDQATSWVISMILSFLQNVFIGQPVKVLFLSLLLSLMLNRMPWLNQETEQQTKRILALLVRCSSLPGSRDKNNPIYTAPNVNSPVQHPARNLKDKKLFMLIGDILVQILFLVLLMTTVYSAQNSSRFHLQQTIRKSFSQGFSEIKFLKQFYSWANCTLLPNLYGNYRGFITDGNSFLLGNVLLRQVRIPATISFPATVSLQVPVKSSHTKQEDTENYGVNWGPLDTNINESDNMWHYQKQDTIGGYPIQGEFATYSGGGYVVKLGRNSSAAIRVLQHLESSHWLDHCTKGLFVEFVVFNANVNLLCVVTLMLESNNMGSLFTSVRLDSLTSLQTSKKDIASSVISQVVYYLLVCYYAFVQGHRLKQQSWGFFTKRRNILDMSIILISFVILGLDMKRISLHNKNMAEYRANPGRFVSFYEEIKVNSAVIYLVGFLVLLATVQLWNLLHYNPRLQVIGRTLNKAWDEVVGFLLVILILLTGYAIAFNLLFGWSISDYQTFLSSAVTVVGLLVGTAQHKEVIALDPILGSFLILTSVILLLLVIINLFVSAILMAFGKERKLLKTRKEATLIDMLLQKLSSLLGIQLQQNMYANSHDNSH